VLLGYASAVDCADLADDFMEVFQRAGWSLPTRPGVPYNSFAARGFLVRGKPNDTISPLLIRAIEEATYITTESGPSLSDAESLAATGKHENGLEIKVPIEVIILIAFMRRKPAI
jgi:hypothetical protein